MMGPGDGTFDLGALKGRTVSRIWVDSALGIQFFDEPSGFSAVVRIEGSFRWADEQEDAVYSADHPVALGPVMRMLRKLVQAAYANERDGSLTLSFADGSRLTVIPDEPQFEAWQYRDSNNLNVISMPGGSLGIWE